MGTRTGKRKLDSAHESSEKRRRSDVVENEVKYSTRSTPSGVSVDANRPFDRSHQIRVAPGVEADSTDKESSSESDTTSDSDTTSSDSDSEDDVSEIDPSGEDDSSELEASSETEMQLDTSSTPGAGDAMISLPKQIPPDISTIPETSDLQTKLATFLPQLKAANANLADDDRIDDVNDDEDHYIEMDLGLGVLKEKRRPATNGEIQVHDSSSSSSDTTSVEAESDYNDVGDVLQKMMGKKAKKRTRPTIQEFDKT